MTPRPLIFISSVSRELRSARQLVANTLTFLGYQPIWQDIFGTESGDLREMLRKQIDQCKGVVQLIGQCYGAEPPAPDEKFGRVSYTQYEALYARERGKKTWYLFIDEDFPADPYESEPAELRELQATYRRRLQSDSHVFHSLTTAEGLEASVLKLRDDLTRLRRGVKQWALAIAALLVIIAGLVIWQLRGQAELKSEMAKLREGIMDYPQIEAQVRGSHAETDPAKAQERIYAELAKQLKVDPKILREKLPRFAEELRRAPNVSTYERANASYVSNDFGEAERLALQAAGEARKASPANSRSVLQALELAGLSAHKRIQYASAMEHFREAEKLTDPNRNLQEWARLQHAIADLLFAQGKYADAEKLFRSVIEARTRVLGSEHSETLQSRHRLIYALTGEAKHAEAEAEARHVLSLREKVLGPEHPDTLVSRYNLANVFVHEGKYAPAETLYRDVVRSDDKVLGPEHPNTVAARDVLANVLDLQGKNAEAQALYRDVIKIDNKIYGPEHPQTLNDRMNLATSLQADSRYREAETEYRDVIRMEENVVGPEHPDTLISRDNFAANLDDEGKFADAEAECRQIIPIEEKVLGPQHRVTLNSRGNLAVALIGQGKFTEAREQYREVLELMERVLGIDHPDTLTYATKIATGLSKQNKREEAIELAKQMEKKADEKSDKQNPANQKYAILVRDLEQKP